MKYDLNGLNAEKFKLPPKMYQPMVRWWWPGLDVIKEELIREVKELDEMNIYGAEIQSFMIGVPTNLEKKDRARAERSHRYMQPYYFEMLKAVLDEAKRRDMIVDITENSAWPAGGVDITKELSMKMLLFGQKVIKGGINYSGKIPKFKKLLFYRILSSIAHIVEAISPNLGQLLSHTIFSTVYPKEEDTTLKAVVAVKPIGKPGKIHVVRKKTHLIDFSSSINITDKVNENGIIEWDVPEGKWQIFAFYQGPSNIEPLFDAKSSVEGKSLVMGHFSSKPIIHHLENHFGEQNGGKKYFAEHYGNTFRAFFTDSLELSADWHFTDDFIEKFRKYRGYDITPYLPVCYTPKKDNKYILVMLGMGVPCFDFKDEDGISIGDRIRWDYDKTLSDLFCDEYTKTMADWAEKHKLKSRIQAYGIEADTLKVWGLSHISETEQLYAGGTIDFHKFAGSSGAINAQPITCSETLIWMHRDYLTNPLKWKISADRLLISGINQMIYHGYPYQNPDFPYPGFHYSTPYISNTMRFSTNCNTMNSLSDFFPYLNLYISRGQYAMQHGKNVCKIGTYYPLLNYCDGALKRDEITGGVIDDYDCKLHGPPSPGKVKEKGFDKHELWLLEHLKIADNLMENGYNYTHINEESILNAEIDGKVLKIGICEFETLIFNCIESISVELAEKIKKIVEADIPVVFIDHIPDRQRGFFNYKENDKKIKQVLHEEIREKIQFIKKDTDLSDFLTKDLNITPQVIFDCKQPTIQFIHKKTDNSDIYYLRHSVKTPLKISAKFKHGNKIPYVMDPSTGNVQQLSQYTRIDDGNLISTNLYFEGFGSIILEFRDVDDNTEESTYIIECPIKTERLEEGNGKISGLIDTPGNYSFKLSDGTEKNVTIHENEIASPIRLKQWNFHSDIRDYLGNYSPLDLVINDETNWMDIKELKYSSDRGIYSSTFLLTKEYLKENSKLILNLGRVCEVALVKINEKELDPILFYPYESDITEFVQEGENSIEVTVVPTLHNQLVGYAKKDSKNFHNHKNRPLIPSGLVKPVRIFQKIMVKFD